MNEELDQVSPFQIAWIMPDDEADDTARIMVVDPLEFRIVIFEADTGLPMSAGADAVAERARELLEKDGGFIVHAIEPYGQGLAAVVEVPREACDSRTNPPTTISPGKFTIVFEELLQENNEPFPFEITFTWEGETAASFIYDAWVNPDEPLFVAEINTNPISGWVSWVNEKDLFIAFTNPMASEEGWARVTFGAPGAGAADPHAALSDSDTWVRLAKLIHAIASEQPVEQMTRHVF